MRRKIKLFRALLSCAVAGVAFAQAKKDGKAPEGRQEHISYRE